jgi:hypothetical protein
MVFWKTLMMVSYSFCGVYQEQGLVGMKVRGVQHIRC